MESGITTALLFICLFLGDRENLWKVRIAHYPYMTANEIYGEMRIRQ